jgi:Zn-dependent peptidase ImmA (M78 family)
MEFKKDVENKMISDKIIIGGQNYTVELSNPSTFLENKYDGRIIYDQNKIVISKDININYQNEVLAHEILHGIFEKSGTTSLKNPDIETMVTVLTNTFYNFLKDNTDFYKKMDII